MRLNSTI